LICCWLVLTYFRENMQERPSPEKLLQRIKEEEQHQLRGKLKIYLGAAPGVGKTYSMLHDAQTLRNQGLDVVIGIVESHGRQEIEAMLKNFEIIPRRTMDYRGRALMEFDLDAAFKRNPGLILLDEMAHTNVPESRHPKRWLDIKELLDRGIDVYTTMNVQHIESLNDVVSQIIHTQIKETVPDSMVDMADTIELIDLPPEELLKRLKEGKIYLGPQAELAKESFFRKGNLIALRELALRVTAERVGTQVLLYRQDQGIKHIWPTKDKILVCVGYSAESAKLIRSARRIAANLQTDWIAIHVDRPQKKISDEERNIMVQNLRLAEQLGAQTRILTGFDAVKEILNFAHEQNITQIVIGKQIRTRWHDIFFRSLPDELIRHSGEIDVYVITGEKGEKPTTKTIPIKRRTAWHYYGNAFGIITIATLVNIFLFPILPASNLIMIYLLSVTLVALLGEAGPTIFASIISMLAYDFFFVPPYYSFFVFSLKNFITLVMMLIISQVIGYLTVITRRHAALEHDTAQHSATLHALIRQLATARGKLNILRVGTEYIGEYFNSEVLILLPENNRLEIRASFRSAQPLNEKELSVARWVFDLGQIAGRGTDTLPFSNALYVPLLSQQGPVGVLRVRPLRSEILFTPEQTRLLEACANQIALVLEVEHS